MDILIDFKEIEELEKKIYKLASIAEIDAVNKKILTQCRDITKQKMKPKIPVAAKHYLSGRKTKGQPRKVPRRGHAKDNIPTRIGRNFAEVGWTLGDNEEYFYVKFLNWGTTTGIDAINFIDKTKTECENSYAVYAEKEYQEFLKRYLG